MNSLAANLLPSFDIEDTKTFLAYTENRDAYFSALLDFLDNAPENFFVDKLETYLVCLDLSSRLRKSYLDDELDCLFEEFSLYAITKTLQSKIELADLDLQLIIKDLPKILVLPYPIVERIRVLVLNAIPKLIEVYQICTPQAAQAMVDLNYLNDILKVFDNYKRI